MYLLLIITPLVLAFISLFISNYRLRSCLLPLSSILQLFYITMIAINGWDRLATHKWFGFDALSIIILFVVSVLYLGCTIYAVEYLNVRIDRGNRIIVPCLLIFISMVTLAVSSRHLGMMWFAVEGTTMVSAPLIYYNSNKFSIEATWKYLILCSFGIIIAMLGIFFIAYSSLSGNGSAEIQLDFLIANAASLDRAWLLAGFILLMVGFGTKMGLAPLHSWKPDAYGEAPGIVGALLAGGLTSVAFLAVMRGVQIMNAAGYNYEARKGLLILGLFSIIFASIFMVKQSDIKRMLAYSSVEHMGILVLGVGIGGIAILGSLLHLINNSLIKGCMFLSAGNIHRAFANKNIAGISGAVKLLPFSGYLFLAGFFAMTGSPPFGLFVSEFNILKGIFASGNYVIGIVVLGFLGIAFIGIANTVLKITQGEPEGVKLHYKDSMLLVFPPFMMILIVLCIGVFIPDFLLDILYEGAKLLGYNNE